ncbi:hypothetical protein ACXHXM_34015
MQVWVMTGSTESGDDYGPYVFADKPSEAQMQELLKRDMPFEFEDADGPWGYCNTPRLFETEVR